MRRCLPSLITALGHALSLGWLAGGPAWLAVLGLLCDVADGALARHLRVTTAWGALYDWLVDCTLASLVAVHLHLLPLVLVLVPLQVTLSRARRRVSGRAALVLWALGAQVLGGGCGAG